MLSVCLTEHTAQPPVATELAPPARMEGPEDDLEHGYTGLSLAGVCSPQQALRTVPMTIGQLRQMRRALALFEAEERICGTFKGASHFPNDLT
jgi:hypothetical protein